MGVSLGIESNVKETMIGIEQLYDCKHNCVLLIEKGNVSRRGGKKRKELQFKFSKLRTRIPSRIYRFIFILRVILLRVRDLSFFSRFSPPL